MTQRFTGSKLASFAVDLAKRHLKTVVQAAIVILAWVTVWAVIYLQGSCPSPNYQGWLELINGATWPSNWSEICCDSRLWFSVALATRTTLNLAGPIAVIGASVWVFSGGLERSMHMSRLEMMRLLSAAVVSSVAGVVRKHHADFTVEELSEMQAVADKVVESYMANLDKHQPADPDAHRQDSK